MWLDSRPDLDEAARLESARERGAKSELDAEACDRDFVGMISADLDEREPWPASFRLSSRTIGPRGSRWRDHLEVASVRDNHDLRAVAGRPRGRDVCVPRLLRHDHVVGADDKDLTAR